MRVQCDVCENAEAAAMCCADEAALCKECDIKVHAANKLAIKHQRVSLFKDADAPRCDICQEKTGFFFCLQERALLCRNCDVSIHTANALSSRHQRFLVTGIRVALEAITLKETSGGSSEGSLKSETSSVMPNENTLKASLPPAVLAPPAKGLSGTFLHPGSSESISGIMSESSSPSALSIIVPVPSPPSTTSEVVPQVIMPCSMTGMGLMPAVHSMGSMTPLPRNTSNAIQMLDEPFSVSQQSAYENSFKRNSIAEFLTETIPGWRVDELLNMSDPVGGYTLVDVAPSKVDALNPGDFDWTANLNLFDSQNCGDSFHTVPELFSLNSMGLSRSGRITPNPVKGQGKQEYFTFPRFADSCTVPDLGLRSLPDSPTFLKRRRYG